MIARAKIAFIKASHGRATTVKKPLVDRQIERRALAAEHVNDSGSGAEGQQRLAVPTLKCRPIRVFRQCYAGRLRFLAETDVVARPAGGSHEFDLTAQTAERQINGVINHESAR